MPWASQFCSASFCAEVRILQAVGPCQEPARRLEASTSAGAPEAWDDVKRLMHPPNIPYPE